MKRCSSGGVQITLRITTLEEQEGTTPRLEGKAVGPPGSTYSTGPGDLWLPPLGRRCATSNLRGTKRLCHTFPASREFRRERGKTNASEFQSRSSSSVLSLIRFRRRVGSGPGWAASCRQEPTIRQHIGG